MPQIQINGELREVSQAEYDALTQNGQASTPADGSYDQYAAARAKEQAVTKLADGDAALGETTNVSPEFRQELSNIRTNADAAAGDNKDAYATRYDQEQRDLYTNAPLSREALREELSAPPPTTAPGTVGVSVPQQQGTNGQVIGTTNPTIPGLAEPTGPIVSSPVKGLTSGGLTTGAPAAGIESAPTYPTEDPQIPQPSTEGAGTFQMPPPPPDAAFRAEQAQQENRWQQAAATNPEGINPATGSVTIDLGDGRRETINRDGSYEISGGDGTFGFDAAGKETFYTTPSVNGLSVTTTADGIQYTNYTQGPLTTRTISKDGELISTDTSYTIGDTTLRSTEVAGGEVVNSATTILSSDPETGETVTATGVQVGEGEIEVSTRTSIETKQAYAEAYAEANAENIKLREDLIAAKEKTLAGEPLTESETQALEQQAEITAEADANLAQAELALADEDPTLIPPGEDPQVDTYSEADDPFPSLDTTEYAPESVSPSEDPGVPAETEEIAASDIEDTPPEISSFEDPEIPAEPEDIPISDIEDTPVEVSATDDPEVPTEPEEIAAADISEEPAEISSFEDPEVFTEPEPVGEAEIEPGDELVVDDPQAPGDIESFSSELVEVEPTPLTDEEIAEYREQEADEIISSGADFQEDAEFVDDYEEYLDDREEEFDTFLDDEDTFNDDAAEYLDEFDDQRAEEYDDFVDDYEEYLDDQQEEFDDAYDQYLDDEDTFNDDAAEYLDEFEDERAEEYDEFVDDYEEYLDDQQEEFDEAYEDFLDEEDTFNDDVEEYLDEEDEEFDTFGEEDDDLEVDDADEYGSSYGEEDDPLDLDASDIRTDPESVSDTGGVPTQTLSDLQTDPGLLPDQVRAQQEAQEAAARQQAALANARAQAVLQAQRKEASDGDWRVRLRLAPNATYLYKDPDGPGILQPLAVTDGVIFPYTPQITTGYKANYSSYDLTHSNYRGYFYQGSQVEDIQITATFTAQDSVEAAYLLAVIHFFRSVTKMFYGQDAQRGAPPPLVYLQGLGEFQFNLAPCVVANFSYNLPNDVDYIRARSPNINGTNLLQKRDRQSVATNPFSSAWSRIQNVLKPQGINKGAVKSPPAAPILGTKSPTYVPTKMDIILTLHPIQSREQVSKQFSLKQYANGQLLKGGFW